MTAPVVDWAAEVDGTSCGYTYGQPEGAIASDFDGGVYVSEVGNSIVARVSATPRAHAMHGAVKLALSLSLSAALVRTSYYVYAAALSRAPTNSRASRERSTHHPPCLTSALPCLLQVNRSGGTEWALTPSTPTSASPTQCIADHGGAGNRQTALAADGSGGVLVAGNFDWPSLGMPIAAMRANRHGHVLWSVSHEMVKSLLPDLRFVNGRENAFGIVADGSGGAFVTFSMSGGRRLGVCLHVGSEGEVLWVAEPESMHGCKRCFSSAFYGVVADGRGGALISGTTHPSYAPPTTHAASPPSPTLTPIATRHAPLRPVFDSATSLCMLSTILTYAVFYS